MARLTDDELAQLRKDVLGRQKHPAFYGHLERAMDELIDRRAKSRSRKKTPEPVTDASASD